MSMAIQTRCPHCFTVPIEQLNNPDAKGRCGQCQQVFLVNKNLLVSSSQLKTAKETSKTISNDTDANDEAIKNSAFEDPNLSKGNQNISKDGLESISSDQINAWNTPPKNTDKVTISKSATKNQPNKSLDNSATTIKTKDTTIEDDIVVDGSIDTETNLTQLLANINTSPSQQKLPQRSSIKTSHITKSGSPQSHTPIATILWIAGCLVLTLLLFAQYAIFNQNTLLKNPASAARLQALCSSVVCSLPSADLSMLTIDKLSYRSSSVSNTAGFSDIQAELVNQSEQAQLFPSLKVSVYDNNNLYGEFIAAPEDYLLSTQSQLAAQQSRAVMFTVPVAAQQISQISQITITALY